MSDDADTTPATDPAPGDDRETAAAGSRRRRLLALAAAVLLLAVAVVAIVLGTRDGDSDSDAAAASETTASPSSEPAPTEDPAPTEPVDPGTPGDPAAPEGLGPDDQAPPTLAPVSLDEEVAVGAVTGSVVLVEEIEGTSNAGVGNINGPALRVTIRLVNAGTDDLDLSSVGVNLFHGSDRRPASPLQDRSQSPFAGTLPAGDAAEGVYVFTVPVDQRDQIAVEVAVAPGADVIVFSGAV